MNISNYQLAKRLGLHHTYVSRLRSGQRAPSIEVIWRMHQVLGLDIYQLVQAAALGQASFGKYFELKTLDLTEERIEGLRQSPNRPRPMIDQNTILATPQEWMEVVRLARTVPTWVDDERGENGELYDYESVAASIRGDQVASGA